MGNKLNINFTKFKSEKGKINSSANDMNDAEKSVAFASYTTILSSSQTKTSYQNQKSKSEDYISQVNIDMQNLQKLVNNLKKVDDYSALRMQSKVKH